MNNKAVNKDPTAKRDSFTELLGQLANNLACVVHDEIELVIQRTREKVSAVRGGVLTVATGAFISLVAFMCLCAALIMELASYMAPALAALVIGASFALVGVVIAFIGYKQLKKSVLEK
jgi:hypothetical protein